MKTYKEYNLDKIEVELIRVWGDPAFCITLKDENGQDVEILAEFNYVKNALFVYHPFENTYEKVYNWNWNIPKVLEFISILQKWGYL